MKVYAVLSTLIILGLVLSWKASTLEPNSWQQIWLVQLSAAILISGGIGITEKVLSIKEYIKHLTELLHLKDWVKLMAIRTAKLDSGDYQFDSLIKDDPLLRIAVNDGRTWVSSRIAQFQERFSKDGFITEVFVTDPEKDAICCLAKKTGYTLEEQRQKIDQSRRRLISEWEAKGCKGTLRIYSIPFYVTHSAYVGSKSAVVTLYGISSGRRSIPVFECVPAKGRRTLYDDIKDDIDQLRTESKLYYAHGKTT